MNSYMPPNMGFSTAAPQVQNNSNPASVGFNVGASVTGGSGGQAGAAALLVILGGLAILYISSRKIQGSV